jgi:hypothetical protein
MEYINIENLLNDDFKLILDVYNETLRISFYGTINMSMPQSILIPYFTKLNDYILKNKLDFIYIDVVNLDFINSSSLRCLLDWILKIKVLSDDTKYKINFVLDIEKKWQKMSFLAIFNLYTDIIDFNF